MSNARTDRPVAQSTINAYRWLLSSAPDRLNAWLDQHPQAQQLRELKLEPFAYAAKTATTEQR